MWKHKLGQQELMMIEIKYLLECKNFPTNNLFFIKIWSKIVRFFEALS